LRKYSLNDLEILSGRKGGVTKYENERSKEMRTRRPRIKRKDRIEMRGRQRRKHWGEEKNI
jgi:hypothetical protein